MGRTPAPDASGRAALARGLRALKRRYQIRAPGQCPIARAIRRRAYLSPGGRRRCRICLEGAAAYAPVGGQDRRARVRLALSGEPKGVSARWVPPAAVLVGQALHAVGADE